MTFGVIEYLLPDQPAQRITLARPTLTVGSSPGNRLVIDHPSIGRRHARLTVSEGRLIVEDLGSPSGTYVAKSRILPDAPRQVNPAEWVWLGQVKLRYLTPDMVSVAIPTPPADAPAQPVTPPKGVTRRPPPPAAKPTSPPVAAPPATPELQLNLEPHRGKGSFVVEMRHIGPQAATYQLSAGDADDALDYRFEQKKFKLQPGQWITTPLFVSPQVRQRVGSRQTIPFVVLATPLDANGRPAQADGELIVRASLPIWWLPLAAIVFVCIGLSGLFSYFSYCPQFPFRAPFCSPPVIQVFETLPADARVNPGDTVTLNWLVTNARVVRIDPPLGELREVEPFATVPLNPTENVRYTLTAIGGGGTVTATVEIEIIGALPQIVTFAAEPATLVRGRDSAFTLSWDVPGATRVRITGVTGDQPGVGSVQLAAPAQSTTYTLSAFNEATGDANPITAEILVSVSDATCRVTSRPAEGDVVMYDGPGQEFRALLVLPLDTELAPVERTSTGEWLRVQAAGREGWVQLDYIACATDTLTLPTANPGALPTLPPTATPTPSPTAPPSFSFDSSGFISYRITENGRVSYLLQGNQGAPVTLLADKDDIQLLDYTAENGGIFALLAVEAGVSNVYLVRPNGQVLAGAINPGWAALTDGEFSPNGTRLVIEAVSSGTTRYFVFDARSGVLITQPTFP